MLIFALSNLALAGGGNPPSFEPLPISLDTHATHFCAGGLRVTVVEDGRDDLVSLTTVHGGGAADDRTPGELALLERVSLRSRTANGTSVAERLAELGATATVWGDLDTSSFQTLGHSSVLAELLRVEIARIRDPLAGITPEVFLAERRAEAVRLDDVTSSNIVQLARYFASAFQDDHPYAKLAVATPATVNGLELRTLRPVAERAHALANTTVVVRGAADPRIVSEVLSGLDVGDAKCGALAQPPSEPAPQPSADEIRTFAAPVAERILVLGWALPPAFREQDQLIDAALPALSGAVKSGLGASYAQQLKYQPSCGVLGGAQASLAICSMRVPEGTSARSVARRALSRIAASHAIDNAWGTERTARAMAATLNRLPPQIEDLAGGMPIARFDHFTGSVAYFAYRLRQIEAFSGERVAAITRSWFRRDLTHMVLLYPPGMSGDPEAGTADENEDDEDSKGATVESADTEEEEARESAAIRLSDEAPALLRDTRLTTPPWLARAAEMQLENGLRIVVVPWAASAVVRVALVVEGGDASEPFVGLDALTEFMTDSRGAVPYGTSELTLGEAAMRIGGAWNDFTTHDAHAYGVWVAAGQLDAATYLLRRKIDGLALDVTAGERDQALHSLSHWVDKYGDSPDTARWWGLRAWRIQLWGPDHPNARARTEAAWWAFPDASASEIQRWYHNRLRPDRATLFIVGDVDPKQAEAIALERLGDWKRPKDSVADRELEPARTPPEPRLFTIEVPDSRVMRLNVGCPVAPTSDALRQVGEVLLDDALLERLVLDPAISATAAGGVTDVVDGAAVAAVSARVSQARAALALRTIQDVLADLATPLDANRVEKAQATVLRRRVTGWTTGDALLYDLVIHAGPTGDLTSFRSFGDDLRAVTPSDVAALFASCATHVVALAAGPHVSPADLGSTAAIDRETEYRALRNRKGSASASAPGVARR